MTLVQIDTRPIPDPWLDPIAYRRWWISQWAPDGLRCAGCGVLHVPREVEVQLHHLRYRIVPRAWDFIPLCRIHHIGTGFVHSTHRREHPEETPPKPNPLEPRGYNWTRVEHPNLAVVSWRVVRRVRRRSWRRWFGLIPRYPWEGQ